MSLQDILKKRLEAAANKAPEALQAEKAALSPSTKPDLPLSFAKTDVGKGVIPAALVNQSKVEVKEPVKETPAAPVKKSFAEIMAEKKAAAALAASTQSATATTTATPVATTPSQTEVSPLALEAVATPEQDPSTIPAPVQTINLEEIIAANPGVSTEIVQSYVDIKKKILELETLPDGPELQGAMKTLKEALMQNPSACSLMLPTDIGKMVIALRVLTKEALIEASKEKKAGRKPKTAALTVDDIDKVLDEL